MLDPNDIDGQAAAPPAPGDAVWPVFAAILVSVVVAAAFGSARIVTAAERQPNGPVRDTMLAFGQSVHRLAAAVGFDRPYAVLNATFHAADDGFVPASQLAEQVVAMTASGTATRRAPTRRTPVTKATPGSTASNGRVRATSAVGLGLRRNMAGAATVPTRTAAPTAGPATRRPTAVRAKSSLPASERPAAPPVPGRSVSAEAPLRVLVAGDSFAQPLAYELQRLGEDTGLINAELDFKLSSGVSRMDFFDWPARIAQQAAEGGYDVLVFNVGGNDTQSLWMPPDSWISPGSPEWQSAYGQRAAGIMDSFQGQGMRVYWVGIPIMREDEKNGMVRQINAAVAVQAARRPFARFVDTWPMFMDTSGAYNAYLPDADGEETQVRQTDGTHLTRVGTRWVAEVLYGAIAHDWAFPPPATATLPASATPPPTATSSVATSEAPTTGR
jgi:hypothetical protein